MFARSEDKKCECIIQYVNVSYNNQFQLSRCSCRRQNETVFRGCCPGYLNNRILNESLKCSRMNCSAVSIISRLSLEYELSSPTSKIAGRTLFGVDADASRRDQKPIQSPHINNQNERHIIQKNNEIPALVGVEYVTTRYNNRSHRDQQLVEGGHCLPGTLP
jgi:hypothetical protein